MAQVDTSPQPEAARLGAGRASGDLPVVELVVITLVRVVLNTTFRMVYPFLPAFARGLGVTPGAMRFLIGARSAAGFTSPLFGPVSDRFGRRVVMLSGLGLLALGLILVPLVPVYVVAVLAFVLTGLAKVVYDPAIQAYVGDRVPYSRRGLAIGVIEMSWSAGLLLGVPLVGFAIQRFGWSSPFVGLALLAILGGVAVLRFIRPDAGMPVESRTGLTRSWGLLLRHPVAIGALGFAVLIGVANENMFVVYGEWMELSFGLQVSALGLLTAVIGVAELSGELIVATGSDRTGKRRLMLVGLVISALAYAGLPRLDQSLFAALVALFVMFIGFEAAVVSSIPLVTELLPAARGTMMGAFLMAFSIGRTLGALVGDVAWRAGGFALNGLVAAGLNVLAILLVLAVIVDIPSKTGQVSDATG